MGERTIAEIIGWQRTPVRYDGYALSDGAWRKPDGTTVSATCEPTADDLLAWLRDRGYVVHIEQQIERDTAVLVTLKRNREALISYASLYLTALESLEAAVRVVDERQSSLDRPADAAEVEAASAPAAPITHGRPL